MNRSARIIVSALALVLVVAGSALANRSNKPSAQPELVAASPGAETEDAGTPSQQALDKIVERLGAVEIETDAETVAALAETYGVGGAVRLLAWADATGKTPAELGAMFDGGMGWGEIARQLNDEDAEGDLDLRPGIGWVMGGGQGSHGPANAPGLVKKQE